MLVEVARFLEVDKDKPNVHHDALEMPDGQVVLVTKLIGGQRAMVLQLPVDSGWGPLLVGVASTPQHFSKRRRYGPINQQGEGLAMRILIIWATLVAAGMGLGGCWWHHQAAVVTEPMAPPLKLGI